VLCAALHNTYVRTWEGWAYLATVIDLASRKVVGWAMADHMRSSLVCDAMRMALHARRPGPGLMYHSDRGSQYLSHEFRQLLEKHHITQSLSRPAQCWDNSVAEAWFGTYKLELIEGRSWRSIAQTVKVAAVAYSSSPTNRPTGTWRAEAQGSNAATEGWRCADSSRERWAFEIPVSSARSSRV
jgi:transposase InsO family protein